MTASDVGDATDDLSVLLARWLPQQRWFAGRDALTGGVEIVSRAPVGETDVARFEHVLVRVPATDSHPERQYQLWLGSTRELPDRLARAAIGRLTVHDGDGDGGSGGGGGEHTEDVIDALHSSVLSGMLLRAVAEDAALGDVRCRLAEGAVIDADAPGLMISGEQSNTSIVFGESAILKVFRRLEPGPNPDAEVHEALSRAGSPHVARLLGELVGDVDGETTTFGVLTEFLANSADGWLTATASVRDLMAEGDLRADEVGGDFAAEARRLGTAVAEVHRDLATAFGTRTADADQVRRLIGDMAAAAAATAERVPALAEHAPALAAVFARAAERAEPLQLQRIHGDLHLGQTLRTLTGWAVIDFEGEPSKPLEHRRSLQPALRDVAGMLRSFDYAAHHLLAGTHPDAQHAFRAAEWAERNQTAFCDGYAEASGTRPRESGLLRLFELDKAVYEVGYEHDHRPAWVPIPLQAVQKLIRQEDHS